MNILNKIWLFIQGKKATIVALIGLTITFLLTTGTIDKTLADYLSGMLVILAGAANVANYYQK